ncbi:hypothetical protein Pmar_PMAR014850 [Perkinsus marinus ATCC 50983]|uniref:Uncharacterized protein n=1 Tax=Perkinsus marinus (strain ATCC 50983 / TXsc) TaxID=423536 RepID=C5L527_PERM5|nr:hypothetical protein Pmar_PMAR014850 [Perkinsus marinus ATCC 50983]EER08086.1 hypothetical protein Pmar_PMAR014850 [Perkinsus marinus ATCC 50983]|eukprot:XP_002776270.1 hypothetical protein Pmar_PMAR014850 [Perkinsus marinus ATCC 50983]
MNERIMADGDDTSATSGSLFERWMRSRRGSTGEVEVKSEDPKLTIEEESNPIT